MPLPFIVAAATEIARHAIPALVGKFTGEKGERMARAVVETAAEVTGLESPGDDASGAESLSYARRVADELEQRPELAIEFRSRLYKHRETMTELANADRASARTRDVEIRRQGQRNVRADVLAYAAVAMFGGVLYALIRVELPAGVSQALFLMLGQLSAIVAAVYAFEFGSSQGSKTKDSPDRLSGIVAGLRARVGAGGE